MNTSQSNPITLTVRRRIDASPHRLFQAWTEESEFALWWGPEGVACESVSIDLRVGGAYRIANRLPDGTMIWIDGVFEVIERPHRLVYTWRTDRGPPEESRVTVQFLETDGMTDVLVTHERIGSEAASKGHQAGWIGCLAHLEAYMRSSKGGPIRG